MVWIMDTEKMVLRELNETDKELYLLAASEEPGCENLYNDDVSANIMWSLAYSGKGKRKNYAIENENNVFIGFCNIEEGETPEIGINLLPVYQGRGIGIKAIKLLWKKISQERKVQYFVARVEESNVNSIKMFEKLGAEVIRTEESDALKRLRELALVDNSFDDIIASMEKFHAQIRQYSWSEENHVEKEKSIWR